ncbi:hypothetical protein [Phenylobacterium sp.]|uniref:hypothetical protein n=1 Tax=Phenylobacterium sp. TaxID=1871053 RepID=UPI0035AD79C5
MWFGERKGGRWLGAATRDRKSWRRVVWSDFAGGLVLCVLLGGLLAVSSCYA